MWSTLGTYEPDKLTPSLKFEEDCNKALLSQIKILLLSTSHLTLARGLASVSFLNVTLLAFVFSLRNW